MNTVFSVKNYLLIVILQQKDFIYKLVVVCFCQGYEILFVLSFILEILQVTLMCVNRFSFLYKVIHDITS